MSAGHSAGRQNLPFDRCRRRFAGCDGTFTAEVGVAAHMPWNNTKTQVSAILRAIVISPLVLSALSACQSVAGAANDRIETATRCGGAQYELLSDGALISFLNNAEIRLSDGGILVSNPYEVFSSNGEYALTGGRISYKGRYEVRGSALIIDAIQHPSTLPRIRYVMKSQSGEYFYCSVDSGVKTTWAISRKAIQVRAKGLIDVSSNCPRLD